MTEAETEGAANKLRNTHDPQKLEEAGRTLPQKLWESSSLPTARYWPRDMLLGL